MICNQVTLSRWQLNAWHQLSHQQNLAKLISNCLLEDNLLLVGLSIPRRFAYLGSLFAQSLIHYSMKLVSASCWKNPNRGQPSTQLFRTMALDLTTV